MKIGILSFQQAINYGASLQIYALQKVIKNISPMNTEVEVIDYQQPILTKNNSVYNNSRGDLYGLLKILPYLPMKIKKKKKFDSFFDKYITLTNQINDVKELNKFDYMIVGSDQVWNTDIHNYDTTYVLDTENKTTKISYAASLGKKKLSEDDEKYFGEYLPDFSAISVREKSSVEMISKYTKQDVQVTLDPTLLLSLEQWREISKKKKGTSKYILVYQLQDNNEMDEVINYVSQKTGLPIKYIMPKGKNIFRRSSLEYSNSPEEFLGLIDGSEFIITNSFHGTCFSVIFEKQFITVPHKTRGARMIDLLTDLKLEDRILTTSKDISSNTNIFTTINFEEPKKLLEDMKKNSLDFLKGSINFMGNKNYEIPDLK